MTTAIIGTGGLGSVIVRRLAAGVETLQLSSADKESARTLAGAIGVGAVAAADNHDVLKGADAFILGGVEQSTRLESGGDLHDVVVGLAEARSLIGEA